MMCAHMGLLPADIIDFVELPMPRSLNALSVRYAGVQKENYSEGTNTSNYMINGARGRRSHAVKSGPQVV